MKPVSHVIISTGVSLAVYVWLHSFACAFFCLFAGVLIDVDHIFDYFLCKKRIPVSYKELCDFCKYDVDGKISVVFHSYELVMVLWIACTFISSKVLLGITIGATVHLLCDAFANPFKLKSYLLSYRHYHKYDRKKFYVDGVFKNKK